MKKAQLEAIRALVKSQDDGALYNMMAAIRGPDIDEQLHYKTITVAIRSYLGFSIRNCTGSLGQWLRKGELEEELKLLERDNNTGHHHYVQHLLYAVDSIGKPKLIAYTNLIRKI